MNDPSRFVDDSPPGGNIFGRTTQMTSSPAAEVPNTLTVAEFTALVGSLTAHEVWNSESWAWSPSCHKRRELLYLQPKRLLDFLNIGNYQRNANPNYEEVITSHQSKWPPFKSLQIINAGEGVEKGNPPTLLVGM